MKTSARNMLEGTIKTLRPGAVNDEVELGLPGGTTVVAVITHGSAEHMGLRVGGSAFALIKASSVMLATHLDGVRLSTRNQLEGTVVQVMPGAVNGEVTLQLVGGQTVVATITMESLKNLALAPGMTATALVKASSVVLGVQD